MRNVIIGFIRLYQRFISLHLPRSCIYQPSCSHYTVEMIRRHGIVKGILAGVLRILRCHGWFFKGGSDPILGWFSLKRLLSRYAFFWQWRKKR